MRRLWLPVAAGLLAAQSAQAHILRYDCTGYAESPDSDSAVAVSLLYGPDGQRLETGINWMPKQHFVSASSKISSPDPTLILLYRGNLSSAATGLFQLRVLSPPDRKKAWPVLDAELARFRIEVQIDGQPGTVLTPAVEPGSFDLPLTASRTAELEVPPATKVIAMRVIDEKGDPVKAVRYNLDQSQRDALYRRAKSEAEAKAANLKTCQQTG